jgi:hypothetical protein
MIKVPTVFVLGAGASAPYGFDTGGGLMSRARALNKYELGKAIEPYPVTAVPKLLDTLHHSLDNSIDAMLEPREDITNVGKALIARLLLIQERAARESKHVTVPGRGGDWYRSLFAALDAPSLKEALAQPVTFITYNYDRSLEYALANAWRVRFCPDECVDPTSLRQMFIHLHGQLGYLPELGLEAGQKGNIVSYGGSEKEITDIDVRNAANTVQIIHEPQVDDPPFKAARQAIGSAKRVVFLWFGFAKRNVERLELEMYLRNTTSVFATAMGLSHNQMYKMVKPAFPNHPNVLIGTEDMDAYELLRVYPQTMD